MLTIADEPFGWFLNPLKALESAKCIPDMRAILHIWFVFYKAWAADPAVYYRLTFDRNFDFLVWIKIDD